jgi:LPXTG-site transpeptidase (sortase) family protein
MNLKLIKLHIERHWTWRTVAVGIALAAALVAVFNPYYLWENIRFTFSHPNTGMVEASQSHTDEITLRLADLPVIGIRNDDLAKIQVAIGRTQGVDTDGDGLSDALESALGTNVKSRDTDSDGYDDLTEILHAYNPIGPGAYSIDDKLSRRLAGKYLIQVESHGELWYVDMSDLRRYLVPIEAGQVAATITDQVTIPASVPTQSVVTKRTAYAIDTLYIPSLDLTVPVQYVSEATEPAFQAALAEGVVQYPGTALPGSYGNMYIFGHSSDYKWSKGKYKNVFAVLPRIKVGAEVTVTDHSGTPYVYVVRETTVAKATDTQYLSQYGFKEKLLTLQTSYPVGTALKRYIVVAELEK